jgi:hypothetical protein
MKASILRNNNKIDFIFIIYNRTSKKKSDEEFLSFKKCCSFLTRRKYNSQEIAKYKGRLASIKYVDRLFYIVNPDHMMYARQSMEYTNKNKIKS